MTPRREKGEGSIYQRHDHPTCPPLVNGERPKPLIEIGGRPIVWHGLSIYAAQTAAR